MPKSTESFHVTNCPNRLQHLTEKSDCKIPRSVIQHHIQISFHAFPKTFSQKGCEWFSRHYLQLLSHHQKNQLIPTYKQSYIHFW